VTADTEVDEIMTALMAQADIDANTARLKRLRSAAVPRLLRYLTVSEIHRAYALYSLQHCWSPTALGPVSAMLLDSNLEIRRMAAVVVDLHEGREAVAGYCANHVGHPDPGVAAFCFEHAEFMYPDLERTRNALEIPHLRPRAAKYLARYYSQALLPGTRRLIAEDDPEIIRAGLVALIHQCDRSKETHQRALATLEHAHPACRDAAAEFLAWHGTPEDCPIVKSLATQETDLHARASMLDAINCIERRAGFTGAKTPAPRHPKPQMDSLGSYTEALRILDEDRSESAQEYAWNVYATAETHDPHLFFSNKSTAGEILTLRQARFALQARLFTMPWNAAGDSTEDVESPVPQLSTSFVVPTLYTLAAPKDSFGVRTEKSDRAFKQLVHVGEDVSWYLDHACVVAVADGVVRSVRCQSSWGCIIVIEHEIAPDAYTDPDGGAARFDDTIEESIYGPRGGLLMCSLYAHVGPFVRVRPGQAVTAGRKIATIGRTLTWENGGYPAHLHMGLHLGPFKQTPRRGTKVDINYKDSRYRGTVVRATSEGIEAHIRYRGNPRYPVTRSAGWECGYIARWYWDTRKHGWVGAKHALRRQ